MHLKQQPLALAIALGLSGIAAQAHGQQVGPGTLTSTVQVDAGDVTMVGGTSVNTSAGTTTPATRVTGGSLHIDMQAGTPGPITLRTQRGAALYANGGSILVDHGVNIVTTTGPAMLSDSASSLIQVFGALVTNSGNARAAGASAGRIEVSDSIFNDPTLGAGSGSGFAAEGTGTIVLGSGNRLFTGNFTNAVALAANGPGASIEVNGDLPVVMNGQGGIGVYLYNGGQISSTAPISITFNGTSSVGVIVDGSTMAAPLQGVQLNFSNNTAGRSAGLGVTAVNGGVAELAGLQVGGAGAALGAWARAGSTINLTGNSVIDINASTNAQSYNFSPGPTSSFITGPIFASVSAPSQRAGLLAQRGTINSTDTTITINTSEGYGVYAGQNGTALSAINLLRNQVTVRTSGVYGYGLFAASNGQITATDSTIDVADGVAAVYMFGYVNNASNQPATFATEVHLSNTDLLATGSSYGLYSVNQTKGMQNTFSMEGGSLSSDQYAIVGVGPLAAMLTGANVRGTQGLLAASAADLAYGEATIVDLTANNSILEGLAEAETGAEANISLNDNSHWTGGAWNVTNVSVDASSLWTLPVESTVSGLVSNAGVIEFTAPQGDVYKNLFTRNYTGVVGSVLVMNTYLASDDSPTDKLIIDGGSATGNSLIRVVNAGGPGAVTLANGIPLVEVINGGTTLADAFALAEPVFAGPYVYRLHQGGPSAGTEQSWFLRSAIDCSLPNAPIPPCPAPPDPPPPPPPPDPPPDPPDPPPPNPDPPGPPPNP
ncbi:MAG TPA: hypothetical protein VM469_05470, partial [Pseudoxanthomonas sp.]|nr:hypothetical protein [Pseudoxanthomonas sp.]